MTSFSFDRQERQPRRRVSLTADQLVRTYPLGAHPIPVVVEPTVPLRLAAWAADNRAFVRTQLRTAGALLFRGFDMPSVEEFERFIASAAGEPRPYVERSSPRTRVAGNVFTSTDHPPHQRIFLHNEQSYNVTFPLAIGFLCVQPATEGGATPIADTRRVLARIPDAVTTMLRRREYMLVRNYNGGLGVGWQDAFQTNSREAVEQHCRVADIAVEWKPGGGLRTRQVRKVLARHPVTGDLVWFNHLLFFHASTLDATLRREIAAQLEESEYPHQTYYGDGAPIDAWVLDLLRDAYLQEQIEFDWRMGDVLLLDNMLTAHARAPFSGTRRVVVAMAEPYSWSQLLA